MGITIRNIMQLMAEPQNRWNKNWQNWGRNRHFNNNSWRLHNPTLNDGWIGRRTTRKEKAWTTYKSTRPNVSVEYCSPKHIVLKPTCNIQSRPMLGHKTNVNKFKRIEINKEYLQPHGIKLEINNRNKFWKFTSTPK